MTELRPLLTSSTDDFERALLRSTERDELGGAALLRTAGLFGIGASAVLPVVAASHVAASGAPVALWPIVLKWVGFGVCCGAALTGAASLVSVNAPRAEETEGAPRIAHTLSARSFLPAPRHGDASLGPQPVAQSCLLGHGRLDVERHFVLGRSRSDDWHRDQGADESELLLGQAVVPRSRSF
jgi:hypothetical protein